MLARAPCDQTRVRPFLLLVLFLIALAFPACERKEEAADFTLRISVTGPLQTLEPTLKSGYPMFVKGLVFDLLVEPTPDGGSRSNVLSSWERVGPAERRLELKRPLYFSDGSPVGDEDLVASLEAFKMTGRAEGGAVYARSAPGEPPLEAQLMSAVLFRDGGTGMLGTGAFRVESQSPEKVALRRVKPSPGRVDSAELLGFGSPKEAFARALRGEANALILPAANQLDLLKDVRRFTILRSPGLSALAVIFNSAALPTEERRALARAISPHLLARAYGPGCEPYPEPLAPPPVPAGRPLRILALKIPNTSRVALALRRALEPRSGSIELVTSAEAASRFRRGEFDLFINLVQVWPSSVAGVNWRTGSSTNHGQYSNAQVDAALQAEDFHQAERLLEEDPPMLKICRQQFSLAIDARVKNLKLGPYALLQSLPEWEVAP